MNDIPIMEQLSPELRAALEAAINDPMTDDEAVALIIQLQTLAVDVFKAAPPDDPNFALMLVRATNMILHVSDRLGVAVEEEVRGLH